MLINKYVPVPLKLRPYGAIQMCILLLLLWEAFTFFTLQTTSNFQKHFCEVYFQTPIEALMPFHSRTFVTPMQKHPGSIPVIHIF